MVSKFLNFRLRETEEGGVELKVTDVRQYREECHRSLLGKIWGLKTRIILV